MRRPSPVQPPPRPARPSRAGSWLPAWLIGLGLAVWLAVLPAAARAQGVELSNLRAVRNESGLSLDYSARLSLSPSIEEALHRGVPLYFVAQASVYRYRWYWRDERVARVTRSWRVAYQPLTAAWRVSLGGLSQTYASLADALAPLSRVRGWHLADADRLDPSERHTVEFSFRLDVTQLPPPMQIDVGSDYKLGVERSLRVD